jgi:hypothetical protein
MPNVKVQGSNEVKLPAHIRAGLPRKEVSFILCPLTLRGTSRPKGQTEYRVEQDNPWILFFHYSRMILSTLFSDFHTLLTCEICHLKLTCLGLLLILRQASRVKKPK